MLAPSVFALIAAPLLVSAQTLPPVSTIRPDKTAISSAAATAKVSSPTSSVKGLSFDRFYHIWLENTDYEAAAGNGDQKFLASQGISLTNYWALTHPSQPNYAAAVGGDYFGMNNDGFLRIPENVSTIADLLDLKGISWGEYQEGLPYAGFQGSGFANQETGANNYVRKHNPLIMFDSVVKDQNRLQQIKNFSSFTDDLKNQKLPQWAFITPNMTNDGHDTNIGFASTWERRFMEPLLNNSYFMDNSLILLTFDENETYKKGNKIFSILVGGAIPNNLKGTSDNTFYNHYSTLATVQLNWGLPSLGRWDCGANIFQIVGNKTGFKNAAVDTSKLYFNVSYPGPLSNGSYLPRWPQPITTSNCSSGLGVFDTVKKTWGSAPPTYNYTNVYPYDSVSKNNYAGSTVSNGANNSTSSGTGAAKAGASRYGTSIWVGLGAIFAQMAFLPG